MHQVMLQPDAITVLRTVATVGPVTVQQLASFVPFSEIPSLLLVVAALRDAGKLVITEDHKLCCYCKLDNSRL